MQGARKSRSSAYQLVQQAEAAATIAKKTYDRMQNLFNEGVISGQKRDEAYAACKATEAQVAAARSQYDMAKNGAREQEKSAWLPATTRLRERRCGCSEESSERPFRLPSARGEVSNVYPGRAAGRPHLSIMSISIMSDMWGTFNVHEDHLKESEQGAMSSPLTFLPSTRTSR